MKRMKLEVKLMVGSQVIKRFSSEVHCAIPSDSCPMFDSVKKELGKWEKEILEEENTIDKEEMKMAIIEDLETRLPYGENQKKLKALKKEKAKEK